MNFIELAGQERRQIQKEISEISRELEQLPDIRASRSGRDARCADGKPGGGQVSSAWKMYQYLIRLDERALRILTRRENLTARLEELEKERTALDIFILQHAPTQPENQHVNPPVQKKKEKSAPFFKRPSQYVFTNVLCDQHNLFDTKRPLHISPYTMPSRDPAAEIHRPESADRSAPEQAHTGEEIPLRPAWDHLPSGNSAQ